MTFAPGDVVTLKSGGHPMTVVAVNDEEVDCLWIGDNGELFRHAIPVVALTIVDVAETEMDDAFEDDRVDDEDDEDEEEDEEEEDDEDEEHQEHGEKRRAKRR